MSAHTHDAYFKKMLAHPRVAADALRRVLDPALADAIDWDAIELVSTDFVDDDLSTGRADLVFRVRLHARPAFVFVLYEHQSSVDPMMPFRVLVYAVRLWQSWLRRHPRARHLPPIVPAVLYNGARPWSAPLDLHGLFRIPPPLRGVIGRHLPDFEVLLDDLVRADDGEIERSSRSALSAVTLMMLKHAPHDPAIDRFVERIADHLIATAREPGGVEALVSTLYYAYENSDLERGLIERLIGPHLEPATREIIVSTAEKLREEGREEGRSEGVIEGQAAMVQTALRHRFGELSARIVERLRHADPPTLERWLKRTFAATSIDEVFAE